MAIGRGVEVQLHVGDRTAAVVVGQRLLQIADPHVVGLKREVLAAELTLGVAQVADRRREGTAGIKARVDRRALGQ